MKRDQLTARIEKKLRSLSTDWELLSLDASDDPDSNRFVEEVSSLSLFASKRFVVLKQATELSDPSVLIDLEQRQLEDLKPGDDSSSSKASEKKKASAQKEFAAQCLSASDPNLAYVIVAWTDKLDTRTKKAKTLLEKLTVVDCGAVIERDRPAWTQYLMERRNLTDVVPDSIVLKLLMMEPWSLESVDKELEKISLFLAKVWSLIPF